MLVCMAGCKREMFFLLKLKLSVSVRYWGNTTPLSNRELHPVPHRAPELSVHAAYSQDKLFLFLFLQQTEWQLI